MNKYHKILDKILTKGKVQQNKKGSITYLLDEQLKLKPADLLEIFEGHGIARNKLKHELELFQTGERLTERYREKGITWWDYCGPILVNSYPTYFEQLPDLIKKINKENGTVRIMCFSWEKTIQKATSSPAFLLFNFKLIRVSW